MNSSAGSRLGRLFRPPRTERYNVKCGFVARVKLLDDSFMDCAITPDELGSSLLDKIATELGLVETEYFGFHFEDRHGVKHWVDMEESVYRQLHDFSPRPRQEELCFGVQYYVHDVDLLECEITRYLYYLQLKKLVLSGGLVCALGQAISLAAFALQAELGDHDHEIHTREFLSDFDLVPQHLLQNTNREQVAGKIAEMFSRNHTLSPAAAERHYIRGTQLLDTYGIEFYPARDSNNLRLLLGASFVGINVHHINGLPPVSFRWADILQMKPKVLKKKAHLMLETPKEYIFFQMEDPESAKYVWRFFVLQHGFFRKMATRKKTQKPQSMVEQMTIHESKSRGSSPWQEKTPTRRLTLRRAGKDDTDNSSTPKLTGIAKLHNGMTAETPLDVAHLAKSPPNGSHISPGASRTGTPDSSGLVLHVDKGTVQYAVVDRSSRSSSRKDNSTPPVSTSSSEESIPPELPARPESARSRAETPGEDFLEARQPAADRRSTSPESSSPSRPSCIPTPAFTTNHPTPPETPGGHAVISTSLWSSMLSESQEDLLDCKRGQTPGSLNVNGSPPVRLSVEVSPMSPRSEQRFQLQQHMIQGNIYSEFDSVFKKKEGASTSVARDSVNSSRNRFRDILPYDSSRIILNREDNAGGSDYINASRVQMRVGNRLLRYIAAQAPLSTTVTDFWQMVWENKVQVIAMVTNEKEGGKEKCHCYWPDERSEKMTERFGQFRVELKTADKQDWCTTRQLALTHAPSNTTRGVMQLQFIGWPDHGAPERPQVFLDYMDSIRSSRRVLSQRTDFREAPVLVHCSAGVGRTGVTILMDVVMTAFEENQTVDIAVLLTELRAQRAYLVQTPGQYKFIYEALIEYLDNNRLI